MIQNQNGSPDEEEIERTSTMIRNLSLKTGKCHPLTYSYSDVTLLADKSETLNETF